MPKNDLEILKRMTRDCRPDMHEPDEQGLDAEFGPSFRYHGAGMDKIPFDNASSPNPQQFHTIYCDCMRCREVQQIEKDRRDGQK